MAALVPKIKELKTGEEIGRGADGVIFKGEWQGSPCAIKKVHEIFTRTNIISENERQRTRDNFQKECEQSIRLRHPNIIQFFGLYEPQGGGGVGPGFPSLVMELLHCSLYHLLEPPDKSKQPLPMPMQLKLSLLCDVTRGLRYLHSYSPSIIHCNLSSNNILVTKEMVAKIGDLVTMCFFDPRRQSQMSKQPGTAVFMPLEALIDPPNYGCDIDIFSFACVALHTLSGKWPCPTQPTKVQPGSNELIAVSEANRRKQYLDEIEDQALKDLLVECLNNDRHKRPVIVEVYDRMHEFLGKIPNELPVTKLHAYLTIQEKGNCIKQLEDDVTVQDARIDDMQKMVTEKEAQIDGLQKDLTVRDETIQHQGEEIQTQATEIEGLKADIVKKKEEIGRCNQEKTNQQITINELQSKLPSIDLMQVQLQKTKKSFRDAYDKMKEVYSHLFPSTLASTKTPSKLAQSPSSQGSKAPTPHSKLPAVTEEPHSLAALTGQLQSLRDTSSASLPAAAKPSLAAVTELPSASLPAAAKPSLAVVTELPRQGALNPVKRVIRIIPQLESKYMSLLDNLPENYESSLARLQQILSDDQICDILSVQEVRGCNQKILNCLIEQVHCEEDVLDLCSHLEKIMGSQTLVSIVKELRTEIIESIQAKLIAAKQRLNSPSDKPLLREGNEDHMTQEERTEDTMKATEMIATLSEKNTQLTVENIKLLEESQSLMQKQKEEKIMYETKVKQLETEFEGKSLQLAIKFEEENKKLIDDMQKQKEERTEDTVKDKEMIAALSKKNNQLIEKSQRLMQEQKEDKIKYENKVKQLETEFEEKSLQLTIQSMSPRDNNKKLIDKIQKQKQIIQEVMVESNQQIDQILKLKRKNNKLVTTNAKLTQWLRRHSSKIRLKNISNRRSKHKIEQSREKLSELKYFIDPDDSDISISSATIKFGSYYVLYDAKYNGKQYIVKKERIESKEYSRRLLKQEKKVLKHLKNHPCIVQPLIKLKALILLVESTWINLTDFIASKDFYHMYNEVTILQDVAHGLSYMHKKGIIHCNLTGNSILLTEKGRAKLSDFGKAIFYQQRIINNLPVTTDILSHMPPEILTPIPSYSTKVDVFSFGCVIIHTITHELPIPQCEKFVEIFEDGKYEMQTEIYRRSVVVKKLMNYSNIKFHDIVLRCLQDIPDKRPTAQALYLMLKKQKATDVENVCPEVSVDSKMQKNSISLLLEKHLRLLTTLNLSNCKITDQGADMIAKILLHTASLKRLKISSTSLNDAKIKKINISLKSLASLESYEINGNNISDAAADSIAAFILNNAALEELNFSYNKLSSAGVLQIVSALLVSKRIKILDISKNFITSDNIKKLSTALSKCPLMQELNLSHNLLMLTGVLKIVQLFRSHDHLRVLDLSNNAISFSSACADVILSVNQELIYLNVSGRNIRPRFIEDYLSPPNIENNADKFTLQNLYLLQHASLNTVDIQTKFIKASNEARPYSGKDIISFNVDHTGGVFHNQFCNCALVVPPGAVCQGECVEILATASHYDSFEIPANFCPISSFFWISADYIFQIPVYVIMNHYAKIKSVEDINHLFVLKSPSQPVTSKNPMLEIVPNGVYFDYTIGYCVLATNHFCSFCQAKDNKDIPDYFLSLFYKYYDPSKRCHFAEVCFCPSNCECKKVVLKQCKVKDKCTVPESFSFLFVDKEKLWISSNDFSSVNGWKIERLGKSTIHHCEFKYWNIYFTDEAMAEAEENCEYPHRFKIKYFKLEDGFEPLWCNFAVSKESEEIARYNVAEITETSPKSHAIDNKGTPPQALTLHEDLPMLTVLKKGPLMGELNKIVVARINAEWEDVAYALRYEIHDVESIKAKHNNEPKKCCKELLKDWLMTKRGVGERNWSTLLKSIGEVECLTAAKDDILKDLTDGKHKLD